MRLCAFSIITSAASTMVPMAMAIPPSDIRLALTPCQCMTMKASSTPSGRLITATNEERRWPRNNRQTTATTMNSSTSLLPR